MNDGVLENESSSAPRQRSRWYVWTTTPLVAALLLGAIHAVDQPAPSPRGGLAAHYLPLEGHRSVTVGRDGVETVSEHARSFGIEGAFAAPISVVSSILDGLGEEELRLAQWWRASSVIDDRRVTDLFRVSDEGVTQVASWGSELGLVFEPELLLLPAHVSPGVTWSSEGSALGDGLLTYRARFTAHSPRERYVDYQGEEIHLDGDCLQVTGEVTIDSAVDELSTTIAETSLWCEGRGMVWSEGDVDGVPSGLAEVRTAALDVVLDTRETESGFDREVALDGADRLGTPSAVSRIASDPFFGDFDTSGQFPLPPVIAAANTLVIVNERGDDVQLWKIAPDENLAELQWAGHPGGTVTALGAAHGVVAAATSLRRVSVYDGIGRRIWAMPTDDIVRTPPTAGPEDGLLVVTRSGTVHMVDASTGEERWTTRLGADAREVLEVAGSLVLVADERERLTALDAASGDEVWQVEPGVIEFVAVDEGRGLVIAYAEDGAVRGLDLRDGSQRWLHVMPGTARGVDLGTAGVLVVAEESARVLDLHTGAVRWRGEGATTVVMADRTAILTSASEIVLLDVEHAHVIARTETPEIAIGASRRAVLDGKWVIVVDTDGSLLRVELAGTP